MSEKTNISWCDSTLNFWSGCTKVSPGCAHCYAETLSNNKFFGGGKTLGKWGPTAPRKRHASAFKLAFALTRKPWICDACGKGFASRQWVSQPDSPPAVNVCCGASFHRRRIFSLSLGDWLDDKAPIEWLKEMLDTIRQCRDVTWILCTKRPENFFTRLDAVMNLMPIPKTIDEVDVNGLAVWLAGWITHHAIPQNIILLASVENQAMADLRIPQLLKIPAVCRGLSLEPLLGQVDLTDIVDGTYDQIGGEHHFNCIDLEGDNPEDDSDYHGALINWLIIGGESGPKARACNVDWIRSLVRQGQAAGVATFVKQLGGFCIADGNEHDQWPDETDFQTSPCTPESLVNLRDKKGGDLSEWPEDLRVREFPL